MSEQFEFLDLDDLLTLAERLLGTSLVVRDPGLLNAAVARPTTSVGGADAYPGIFDKAAALLVSIVANHALVDGNKRLGWIASAVFGELNGVEMASATNYDVYGLVMRVADGLHDVSTVSGELHRIVGAPREQ